MTQLPNSARARSDPSESAAREQAESAGAVWLARRDAGLTAQEREEFERWLAADPLNAEAWTHLEAVWKAFDEPRRTGAAPAMVRELAARRRRRGLRVRLGVTALAATAAAAAWVFLTWPATWPAAAPTVATNAVLLQPERRVLPDGSVVELNQGAEIEVAYRSAARDVRLLRGEAHFAVAKNPERPFVVTAGGVQARAVGTAFAVKLGSENVELLVTEGRVTVARLAAGPVPDQSGNGAPAPAAAPVLVSAGDLLVVPTSAGASRDPLQVQTLAAAEIEHRLEWREPCLEMSGTPLAEAVAWFNRDARLHLSIDDPELAKLRMSGVFRAGNAEGFVRLLESNYGVRVERRGGGEVVLRRTP
jgi:transmembrane sensor